MTDHDLQQLLGALRDDSPPFPSVAPAVLARLRRERRVRSAMAATAAVAAAALLILTLAPGPAWKTANPPPPPVTSSAAPPPPPAAPRVVRRVNQRPRPSRLPAQPETFTVKMLTADPDIVVYWIVDGQGE